MHAQSCRTMRTCSGIEYIRYIINSTVFFGKSAATAPVKKPQAWTLDDFGSVLCEAVLMNRCATDARAHLSGFTQDSHPDFQGPEAIEVDPSQFSLQNCELLSLCMCRFHVFFLWKCKTNQDHSCLGTMRMIGNGSFGNSCSTMTQRPCSLVC